MAIVCHQRLPLPGAQPRCSWQLAHRTAEHWEVTLRGVLPQTVQQEGKHFRCLCGTHPNCRPAERDVVLGLGSARSCCPHLNQQDAASRPPRQPSSPCQLLSPPEAHEPRQLLARIQAWRRLRAFCTPGPDGLCAMCLPPSPLSTSAGSRAAQPSRPHIAPSPGPPVHGYQAASQAQSDLPRPPCAPCPRVGPNLTQRQDGREPPQEASTFCCTAAGPGPACGWMAFCCCTACCLSFSSCWTCMGWATTVCPADSTQQVRHECESGLASRSRVSLRHRVILTASSPRKLHPETRRDNKATSHTHCKRSRVHRDIRIKVQGVQNVSG